MQDKFLNPTATTQNKSTPKRVPKENFKKLFKKPTQVSRFLDATQKRSFIHKSGFVGSYNTTDNNRITELTISGDYAYLAIDNNYNSFKALELININNPINPTLTGRYFTSEPVRGIAVSGNYAYVANNGSGLLIIDISYPSRPTLVGRYVTSSYADKVVVSGNYAYVITGFSGLQIINISNPTSPTLAGSYDTPNFAEGIAISGNYAYVTDISSGLLIIDISNVAIPRLVGNYISPNHYTYGVAVSGNYAYINVEAGNAPALKIINITNPTSPTLVGTLRCCPSAIAFNGNYAFLAYDYSGFEIMDVNNPASPTLIGGYDPPGHDYCHATGVATNSNYIYFTDTCGLQIIKYGLPLVLVNNQLTISENQTVTLTSSQLSATIDGVTADTLTFIVSNVLGGRFEYATSQNSVIYRFIQQEIRDSLVRFVHYGSETVPSYQVKVSDNVITTQPASATIIFIPVNDAPQVKNPMANQTVTVYEPFDFVVPKQVFNDPEQDSLTLEAKLQTGEPLPDWINFDPIVNRFTGNISSAGMTQLSLFAYDSYNLSAKSDFTIIAIPSSSEATNSSSSVATFSSSLSLTLLITIIASSSIGAILLVSLIGLVVWKLYNRTRKIGCLDYIELAKKHYACQDMSELHADITLAYRNDKKFLIDYLARELQNINLGNYKSNKDYSFLIKFIDIFVSIVNTDSYKDLEAFKYFQETVLPELGGYDVQSGAIKIFTNNQEKHQYFAQLSKGSYWESTVAKLTNFSSLFSSYTRDNPNNNSDSDNEDNNIELIGSSYTLHN